MDYMTKIRQIRVSRSYSQANMADLLQTTQQQYSKYENSLQELPIRHLITICQEFHISADWLLGIKEN